MADVGNGFNPNLDKITEVEMVPDIFHRLKISKELWDYDKLNIMASFLPETRVEEIIRKIISVSMSELVASHLSKIHVETVSMTDDNYTKSTQSEFPADNYTLIAAISEKSGFDYTRLFNINSDGYYELKVDVPFINTSEFIRLIYVEK